MKCDVCGKEFKEGNRPGGIPNGVAFVMKNWNSLTNLMIPTVAITDSAVRGDRDETNRKE